MFGKRVLRSVGVVLAIMISVVYVRYRRDIREAETAAARSTIAKTQCGDVEYASAGTGPPVLVLHGTGGGWDQGLSATEGLVARGFRVIAPSRPGYLRTPRPENLTPEAEADLWSCFLSSLDIDNAAVIGISAGATPAAQFALRHPQRINALILMVPASGGLAEPDNSRAPSAWVMKVMLRWDFPYWMTMRLAPGTMVDLVAVPRTLADNAAPTDRAILDRTIAQMLPISARRHGIAYDAATQFSAPVFPLEQITVPTLIITAKDDGYRTQRPARRAASVIPNAALIEYETGGHLLLGHAEEVAAAMAAFLAGAEE